VLLASGHLRSGRLVRRDDTGVELLEDTPEGNLVLGFIPMRDIARDEKRVPEIHQSEVSPMPNDLPLPMRKSTASLYFSSSRNERPRRL